MKISKEDILKGTIDALESASVESATHSNERRIKDLEGAVLRLGLLMKYVQFSLTERDHYLAQQAWKELEEYIKELEP